MYICIDIGGTKTIIALLDHAGKLLHSVRFATIYNQTDFYENLLQQIKINFVMSGVKAISVAMPGPVKNNRALWLGNLPWHDFDIAKQLKTDFKLPVFVENDANLAALAEARLCAGRSLYLTFSTGIGGGVIENHQLLSRYASLEPGHTEYTYNGKTAEWEDIASAHTIRDKYGRNVDEITDPAAWQDIVERMLLGLIPLTISVKPARIIFGGPLGLALDTYRTALRKKLKQSLPSRIAMPRLVTAKYGNLSVIYGCYYYAKACQSRH
jgi:predicted NBD/HSP70 family sugar kinase